MDDERDADKAFREADALALEAVVAGVVAVVGHEDQERVLQAAGGVEVGDEALELVVDEAEHAEVVGPVAAPGGVVAWPLLLDQGMQPPPLGPRRGDRFRAGEAVRDACLREQAEVRLRDLVRVVRLREAEPEEEGLRGSRGDQGSAMASLTIRYGCWRSSGKGVGSGWTPWSSAASQASNSASSPVRRSGWPPPVCM